MVEIVISITIFKVSAVSASILRVVSYFPLEVTHAMQPDALQAVHDVNASVCLVSEHLRTAGEIDRQSTQ